jgi:hypothetical protein
MVEMPNELKKNSRVMHKTNEQVGVIHSVRKGRVLMIEVRWEQTGIKQWLPAEEVRLWDKAIIPVTKPTTSWGRTTPEYIVKLRTTARHRKRISGQQREQKKVAEYLLSLSDTKKPRTKRKAHNAIKHYNATGKMYPSTAKKKMTPVERGNIPGE